MDGLFNQYLCFSPSTKIKNVALTFKKTETKLLYTYNRTILCFVIKFKNQIFTKKQSFLKCK